MASSENLDYYLSWIPNGDLNQPIDHRNTNNRGDVVYKDLGLIADRMPAWGENIATAVLGLSPGEIAEIEHKPKLATQKRAALLKWKAKLGVNATPTALITAFFDANEIDYVEIVCKVLGKKPDDKAVHVAKKAKVETGTGIGTGSSVGASVLNKVVADSGDIDDSIQSDAEIAQDLSTENSSFNWCSFDGQQDPSGQSTITVGSGAYSAALPSGVILWKKSQIIVGITDDGLILLRKWKMKMKEILALANKWHQPQGKPNYIPEFKSTVDVEDADIILELNESGINKSLPGNAGKAGSNAPTMWLDLSGKDTTYNEYLVVHEFGHALGLGHEHQRSDFRFCVIPFLDDAKMRKRLEKRYKDWEVDVQLDTENATEYDPQSVMHYWFEKEWLKHGYDDKKTIEAHFKAGILSEKMKKALLGVHHCSGTMPTKPSTKDLEFINGVYEKIFAQREN